MSKAVFPIKPAVRPPVGSDYELAQHFYFPAVVGEQWQVVVHVSPGFRTDGASIPRFFWRVFGSPYEPDIFAAAIAHDALYRGEIMERSDADEAFLCMMGESGVSLRKRYLLWLGVRLFGWLAWLDHTPESIANARQFITLRFDRERKKTKMKTLTILAVLAAATVLSGCQTRITAEKYPEQVLPIQQKVTVNGEEQLVTTHYQIASGGWYATARSPLYAAEALEGLEIGVTTNGSVNLALGKYSRDVSTNAVVMVDNMFTGGAKLIEQIGVTYAKIAGGGAQADTVTSVASKVYNSFITGGGDAAKATVTSDATAKTVTVTDGSVCTTCSEDGTCTTGACSE